MTSLCNDHWELTPTIRSQNILSDADTFKASLRGELISDTDDPDVYEEAKLIWNGDWEIPNHPRYVAHVRGVSDIIKCIKFAQQQNLEVTVRCGGHSLKGLSTNRDGLVIDLGKHMRAVRISKDKETVWFEGGCRVRDVDAETTPMLKATTLGAVGNAGTGGLVSGGGFGYFAKSRGLSVDNVVAMEVVTADGRYLVCNEQQNSDLFWACRGGQSNFGVITGFTMKLFDCPPMIYGGLVLYDMEQAPIVIDAFQNYVRDPSTPRECSIHLYSLSLSPEQKMIALQACYLGDPEVGKAKLALLIECAPYVDNQLKPTTYSDYQIFSDEVYKIKGIPSYWRSRNVAHGVQLPISEIMKVIEASPQEGIFVLEHYGGKIKEVSPKATAYPHRGHEFVVTFTGFGFQDPDARAKVKDWIDESTNILGILTGGSYVNYDNGTPESSYGVNLKRLKRIKRKYDPNNFFKCNINITPAETSDAEDDDEDPADGKEAPFTAFGSYGYN